MVKIGPKSLGDARQDICKDKECNLGPVAGYYGGNYPELSCIFVFLACSLSKGIFNANRRYYVWRQPWNALTVINKIVFTGIP